MVRVVWCEDGVRQWYLPQSQKRQEGHQYSHGDGSSADCTNALSCGNGLDHLEGQSLEAGERISVPGVAVNPV